MSKQNNDFQNYSFKQNGYYYSKNKMPVHGFVNKKWNKKIVSNDSIFSINAIIFKENNPNGQEK